MTYDSGGKRIWPRHPLQVHSEGNKRERYEQSADARWAGAVITAFPHLNVAEPRTLECCCGKPFTVDGVTYERVNAGCAIHGLKSR